METYTQAKPFINNPQYKDQREEALKDLDFSIIDAPIIDIIKGFSLINHCFTLQSCYGHFVHSGQTDPRNIEMLSDYNEDSQVDYRIAYMAFTIQNNDLGRRLYRDLQKVAKIDTDYVQLGSADWFWERNVNSYVLQVEPDRYKTQDRVFVSIKEALHLEKVRYHFFEGIREILQEHQRFLHHEG